MGNQQQQNDCDCEPIKMIVKNNPVLIFSKDYCSYCSKAKAVFQQYSINYKEVEMPNDKDGMCMSVCINKLYGYPMYVPVIFINSKLVGGFTDLQAGIKNGSVKKNLDEVGIKHSID